MNAAAEVVGSDHRALEVIRRHKRWIREFLAELADEAGFAESERLGSDLMLLTDGASARVLVEGDLVAAADARRLAVVLIDAHQVKRQ